MDKLEKAVLEAERAGMSYGRFMAAKSGLGRCDSRKTGAEEDAGQHTKRCPECGRKFYAMYGYGMQSYCSRGCARKARRAARLQEQKKGETLSPRGTEPPPLRMEII